MIFLKVGDPKCPQGWRETALNSYPSVTTSRKLLPLLPMDELCNSSAQTPRLSTLVPEVETDLLHWPIYGNCPLRRPGGPQGAGFLLLHSVLTVSTAIPLGKQGLGTCRQGLRALSLPLRNLSVQSLDIPGLLRISFPGQPFQRQPHAVGLMLAW